MKNFKLPGCFEKLSTKSFYKIKRTAVAWEGQKPTPEI